MPSEEVSFRPKAAVWSPGDDPSPAGVRLLTMRGGLVLGFGVLLILLPALVLLAGVGVYLLRRD